ncbi:MAG: hypothetical protein KGN34_18235 [Sphingomonadales bacterium]|nr:hypothetical protein [Sphingomonadales bacterium]
MAPTRLAFTDTTRGIRASAGFAGSADRRLDVLAWTPATPGPWPLAIYCHGTDGAADNATYLAEALAADGWLVAAPFFPLTSPATHTRITGPDISDAGEQVRDVRFLIDALLADPAWSPRIDAGRIAVLGHSLGAITAWFAAYGQHTRDPRITAAVMLGAGDPAVMAQTGQIGLEHAGPVAGNTPALLVTAEKDLFSRMMGPPGTAFPRLPAPKAEVTIAGGVHVWFHDGDDWPADHANPDALWFAERSPAMVVPGSEERVPLIGPFRQRAITLAAVRAFLGACARDNAALRDGLRHYDEVTVQWQD